MCLNCLAKEAAMNSSGLQAQFAEAAKLEQAIKANMTGLGYGG